MRFVAATGRTGGVGVTVGVGLGDAVVEVTDRLADEVAAGSVTGPFVVEHPAINIRQTTATAPGHPDLEIMPGA